MDPASLLALVLLASFAIDRIGQAFVFLLSRFKVPEPVSKLVYFGIASPMAVLFIRLWKPLPLFSALMPKPAQTLAESLNDIFTFIILVGGADGISSLLETRLKGPTGAMGKKWHVVDGNVSMKE